MKKRIKFYRLKLKPECGIICISLCTTGGNRRPATRLALRFVTLSMIKIVCIMDLTTIPSDWTWALVACELILGKENVVKMLVIVCWFNSFCTVFDAFYLFRTFVQYQNKQNWTDAFIFWLRASDILMDFLNLNGNDSNVLSTTASSWDPMSADDLRNI